jgi:heavy metal sensor kinase
MLTFLPIRWRLAAWYFCTLGAILTFVAAGSWLTMRRSLEHALDLGLTHQLNGLRDYIAKSGAARPEDLPPRLAPISGMSDLFRVYDAEGRLICESTTLTSRHLRLPAPDDADSTVRYRSAASAFSLRLAYQRYRLGQHTITLEVGDPVRKFETALQELTTALWLSLPILLAIGSLGGFWLSARALQPVDQLTKDARAITATDLSRRLAVPPAKDELRRLSETLNVMLDRIENSFRQVRRFTADASHELRAPVTLIHTAAEFSLRRKRSAEELEDGMRKILREAQRTARLIDDLLVLARADSDPTAFVLKPMDLAAVLDEVAEQAGVLAAPHGVSVTSHRAPGALRVNGDEASLRRLLLILVDNAVKYTPAGGHLTFDARTEGDEILVAVADSGAGIAEEDLPRVFERFWRASKVRSRELGGAGLGLSIAKEIADRHGARLAAASQLERGSTFTLVLPAL